MRGLFDTGSHLNLIANSVIKRYGFRCQPRRTRVTGLECTPVQITRHIKARICSWFDPEKYIEIVICILPRDSKWKPSLPNRLVHSDEIQLTEKMALADPMFWKPENVQLLLGIDACTQILETPLVKLNGNMIQQNTKLGSIVMGSVDSSNLSDCVVSTTIREDNSKGIESLVKRFWEIEEVPLRSNKSKEHELVEKIFNEKFTRDKTGRFSVPIPLNPKINRIGESRHIALKRFRILENRFAKEPEYQKQYIKFMREYEALGHMIKVDHDVPKSEMVYYIPHHATVSSGSFKVVFDCSCKTDEGISLNQAQLVGPKLQRDLYEIILRSRRHKIAMSVDVKKMFRQIQIIPEQWDLQRIFWRESISDPLKEYWLVTVIYGQASSPTNAVMVMNKGAETM